MENKINFRNKPRECGDGWLAINETYILELIAVAIRREIIRGNTREHFSKEEKLNKNHWAEMDHLLTSVHKILGKQLFSKIEEINELLPGDDKVSKKVKEVADFWKDEEIRIREFYSIKPSEHERLGGGIRVYRGGLKPGSLKPGSPDEDILETLLMSPSKVTIGTSFENNKSEFFVDLVVPWSFLIESYPEALLIANCSSQFYINGFLEREYFMRQRSVVINDISRFLENLKNNFSKLEREFLSDLSTETISENLVNIFNPQFPKTIGIIYDNL